MNRKLFRTIFLPSVIFLFSVFVLGQSGWACDEPDYPDDQCYEQLDIKKVKVDQGKILIRGHHFDNGGDPAVTLGGDVLDVDSATGNDIVAWLPAGIEAGQYKLVVSTGDGRKCRDKHSVTIRHHEEPPCPPSPPTCPEACPPGPQGPPGITGWKIVPASTERFTTEDLTTLYGVTAICGTDYKVTGGGFSQNDLDITVNGPLDDKGRIIENGWRAVGTIFSGIKTTLTVYAICACVNPEGCK